MQRRMTSRTYGAKDDLAKMVNLERSLAQGALSTAPEEATPAEAKQALHIKSWRPGHGMQTKLRL